MGWKYCVTTLGCKVNQYESQLVRELLASLGFEPAQGSDVPHLAIINTCAVTSAALGKSRQAVRRFARGGQTDVVVIGCGAGAQADRFLEIEGVAAVWDHQADIGASLRQFVVNRFGKNSPQQPRHGSNGTAAEPSTQPDASRYEVWMNPEPLALANQASARSKAEIPPIIIPLPITDVNVANPLAARIERLDGHRRAFLKVQDGCDAHCTYCIIPRLRTTLRSKPIPIAVSEAQALVRAGHREIVVTGIFLGAFGRETAIRRRFDSRRSPLAALVDALARVEGLERLRLSSLEPGDVDQTLLDVLGSHENCVPHLHLPLQSGSERILRRMNRQYGRDDFIRMIDRVRRTLDQPAISTDIIVGFPGETEEEFQATLNTAHDAGFLKIHAFPFSPREGTAAAKWKRDFVPPAVARDRMDRLRELEQRLSLAYRQSMIGRVERVLVEDRVTDPTGSESSPADDLCHGRSDRYFRVYFPSSQAKPGDMVPVRIDSATPRRTHGTYTCQGSYSPAYPAE